MAGEVRDQTAHNPEFMEIKAVIEWTIITLIPLTALFMFFGWLSGALTLLAITFECGLSIASHILALVSVRSILGQTVFKYPYGTGKLENFSSFFYGTLLLPVAVFVFYSAAGRFISPPDKIAFGLTQIPLGISILRSAWMMLWIRRIRARAGDSPILRSYHLNYKVTITGDISVLAALTGGWALLAAGMRGAAFMVDPITSGVIAAYALKTAWGQITHNFKSLADLPLPEEDQMKILQILTAEFDSYSDIGNIRTRMSGKTRFVEIELAFSPETPAEKIIGLRGRLESRLKELFSPVQFNLIISSPEI
jgi:cation diffusion facilitator family transporter